MMFKIASGAQATRTALGDSVVTPMDVSEEPVEKVMITTDQLVDLLDRDWGELTIEQIESIIACESGVIAGLDPESMEYILGLFSDCDVLKISGDFQIKLLTRLVNELQTHTKAMTYLFLAQGGGGIHHTGRGVYPLLNRLFESDESNEAVWDLCRSVVAKCPGLRKELTYFSKRSEALEGEINRSMARESAKRKSSGSDDKPRKGPGGPGNDKGGSGGSGGFGGFGGSNRQGSVH